MRIHMEIITLLRANIRYRKGSYICVILLMFMISLSLTTIISVNENISKRSSEAMDKVGIGDLVVFISDLACTDDMIFQIKSNPEVASVEVIPTLTSETMVNGIRQENSILFAEYDPENHPYQVYSENETAFVDHPEPLKHGETYVPISFKSMFDCKVGDAIILLCEGGEEQFIIKGFIEEPFVGAELIAVKQGLISEEDFDRLYSSRVTSEADYNNSKDYLTGCNLVNIYRSKNSDLSISELKRLINQETNLIDYDFSSLSKEQSSTYTMIFIRVISGILSAFIVLLFVVTLIVMGHNISTGIEMDYVNLGVLKSQGFSKNRLRRVLLYQYLIAEIAGIGLGMLLCMPAIHLLNRIYVPVTGLLASSRISFITCGGLLFLILLVSCFFVFIKTKKVSEISPIRAIAGGRDSVFFASRLIKPMDGHALFLGLAFRQLISNKRQYISSGLIVAILVFFMITVTNLSSVVDEKTVKEIFGSTPYDISINYIEAEEIKEQVEQEILKITDITDQFQITSKYFVIDEEEYCGQIYSDPKLFKSILKGRAPIYDNEIVITELVSEEINKEVGDTVKVTYQNKNAEFMITGIFQSVTYAGMTFGFSQDAMKTLDSDFQIRWTNYQLADPGKASETIEQLTDLYGDLIEVEKEYSTASFYDTIIVSFQMISLLAYTVSILFVFIVVLMVCDRMLLKEQRDLGIYKAIGFTSLNLRLQFSLRFLIVAIGGSILGMIANLLWSDRMMSTLLRNVGITNYKSDASISAVFLPTVLISLCFFVFAYFMSRKIKRVNTKCLIVE